MKRVLFFRNGNTGVFNEQGEQIPELQEPWLKLFIKFLEEHDQEPMDFEFHMPDGSRAKVVKTENGYSWMF